METSIKLKIVMVQNHTTTPIKECSLFSIQWKRLFNAQNGVKDKDKT